jgi:hypothetical protein
MAKKTTRIILFFGLILGFALNGVMNTILLGNVNIFYYILIVLFFVCYSFLFMIKGLKGTFLGKIRLSLLGVAIASFIYALYDAFRFNYGSSLDVASFLSSIVLGSILSVFEGC